jgi:hypothetical protein
MRTTEDEILKTLASIQRSAAETDQVSAATAEVIYAQGEQIDNIGRNADKIAENVNTSEWLIRGLKGWTGRIANAFSGPAAAPSSKYPEYMPSQAVRKAAPEEGTRESGTEFDREVDKQLDQISSMLGGIHARSLEISDSISRQVKTVEAVDRSIDRSNQRIRKQHDDIRKLR